MGYVVGTSYVDKQDLENRVCRGEAEAEVRMKKRDAPSEQDRKPILASRTSIFYAWRDRVWMDSQ